MHIYMCTILAYLRDFLTYMRQVAIHKMDYVDAGITNILSPDILPVEYLRNILRCTESELPSTVHLPISLDDTLHFYQYLNTHILIAEGQFLLMCPYRTEHSSYKYMKFSIYQFKIVTYQPSIKLTISS